MHYAYIDRALRERSDLEDRRVDALLSKSVEQKPECAPLKINLHYIFNALTNLWYFYWKN